MEALKALASMTQVFGITNSCGGSCRALPPAKHRIHAKHSSHLASCWLLNWKTLRLRHWHLLSRHSVNTHNQKKNEEPSLRHSSSRSSTTWTRSVHSDVSVGFLSISQDEQPLATGNSSVPISRSCTKPMKNLLSEAMLIRRVGAKASTGMSADNMWTNLLVDGWENFKNKHSLPKLHRTSCWTPKVDSLKSKPICESPRTINYLISLSEAFFLKHGGSRRLGTYSVAVSIHNF